jgi:hydroxyacylglutathione hydrolase
MKIKTLVLGALGTNCHIVHREEGTLVIDPASDAPAILAALQEEGWGLDAVVLTHAHFDHILAVNDLPVDCVYLNEADAPLLFDARRNLSALCSAPFRCAKEARFLKDGEAFMGFEALHTPGHTPGGLCLYDWKEKVLFSGDTLFRDGFGRTDFPGGDEVRLRQSLDRLFGLPGESRVLTGHGTETTIARERRGGTIWNG